MAKGRTGSVLVWLFSFRVVLDSFWAILEGFDVVLVKDVWIMTVIILGVLIVYAAQYGVLFSNQHRMEDIHITSLDSLDI